MKSILTALGNPRQYNQLKKIDEIALVAYDIQYKEGVLEYLDESIDIDYILLSDKLLGDMPLGDLIRNIKTKNNRIKIILITDRENLHVKVYKKIGEFDVQAIINIIENKPIYNSQTIPKLVETQENQGKIITVIGANGIGKSTFTVNIANVLCKRKVLLIDFDLNNNSLETLLRRETQEKQNYQRI